MSDARERILARVRGALSPLPARAPHPGLDGLPLSAAGGDLWERFAERLTFVGGLPIVGKDALRSLASAKGWLRGYCDPGLWNDLEGCFSGDVSLARDFERANIDSYDFAITRADLAIAETGTLVLSDALTSRRLAAVAPWVHIAVVSRASVVPDLVSALERMPRDPNVIWVTGPSKTADVEGILIEGVHGPGIQVALCLD